ncbi:MAG: type ISP restriction/modification enzyme [Myxococcota bacterium]
MLTELERAVAREAVARDQRMAGRATDRRSGGVVHTPPELARYGARAVDDALRGALDREHGLADPRVTVLDPSCGPGAFLAATLAVAEGPGPFMLLGLDRDRAAIRGARARLQAAARSRGYPLALRAVDTLASLEPWPSPPPAGATVAILGNPPWAVGSGTDTPPLVDTLLEDFRLDAGGQPLRERRIGVLRDAYVRFWRWAAEMVRRADGGGVVWLVTNGSFLEGPVHRGMRAALLRWFDGIDVLDLGGSALVASHTRRDDNVFAVRPQVVVTLAWKRPGASRSAPRLRHARMWGARRDKLERLAALVPGEVEWSELRPRAPALLLVPTSEARWPAGAVSLAEAMPFHREGVQTNRDRVAIDADRERLLERLRAFAAGQSRDDLKQACMPLAHYDPERAREAVGRALARDPDGQSNVSVRPLAYRPFDVRWFAPLAPLCHRPRPALLRAMDRSDVALLTVRKDRGGRPWAHFGAVAQVPDNCWLSARSSCRTRAFPTHRPDGAPNLDPAVAALFAERVEGPVHAGDFLRYALGVLASRSYRQGHDALLRVDYPRLPLPSGATVFRERVAAGDAVLRALLAPPETSPQGEVTIGHGLAPASTTLTRALERAEAAYVNGDTPPG